MAFLRDVSGSVGSIFGLAIVPLVLFIGGALDYSRSSMTRTQLQQVTDSAAIAAVRMAANGRSPDQVKIETARFVREAFAKNHPGVVLDDVTVKLSGSWTADVDAGVRLSTVLTKLASIDATQVRVTSQATTGQGGAKHLALVMDLTGSLHAMGLDDDLRMVARDIHASLSRGQPSLGSTFVSVIPFSSVVNVGPQHTNFLSTKYNPLDYSPDTWRGCVLHRADRTLDTSDVPPPAELFDPYIWRSEYVEGGYDYNDWKNHPLSSYRDGTVTDSRSGTSGPNVGCPPPIQPLTNVSADISFALNNNAMLYTAGGTNLAQGLVWGWRTLSPAWRTWWQIKPGTPLPSAGAKQILVLMTDGENNIISMNYGSGLAVSALGEVEANKFGIAFDPSKKENKGAVQQFIKDAEDELSLRTQLVCDNIKKAGIEVYTILFSTQGSRSKKDIQQCASSPDRYFEAQNYAELKGAYDTILADSQTAGAIRLSR